MSVTSLSVAGCGGAQPAAATPADTSSQVAASSSDLMATVVGTIGRDHLTKDGYPLTKIADIISVFKPDMLLIQVRPDAYKDQKLEDASYEMTYVNSVAGTAGVDTEPFDWFRDQDSMPSDDAAPPPTTKKGKKGDKGDHGGDAKADAADKKAGPADPFNYMPPVDVDPDNADAFKSEGGYLNSLGPLSFTDANNEETSQKIWASMSAQIRYTKGYSPLARRLAWMGYNATQAYTKQKGQVHRLMVVTNVRYRAAMEQVVAGLGATLSDPVEISKKADQMHDSVPDSVITEWNREIDRLKDKMPKHGPETLRQNILQKIAILQAAVDKKGACCVDVSALAPKDE